MIGKTTDQKSRNYEQNDENPLEGTTEFKSVVNDETNRFLKVGENPAPAAQDSFKINLKRSIALKQKDLLIKSMALHDFNDSSI